MSTYILYVEIEKQMNLHEKTQLDHLSLALSRWSNQLVNIMHVIEMLEK